MRAWIVAAVGLLSGCIPLVISRPPTEAEIADAARRITCVKGDDCDVKWTRAQAWILQNSAYKLQNATDMLLETYGSPRNSTLPAFVVSRLARADGTSEIDFNAWCGHALGCGVEGVTTLRAKFVRFVLDDGR